MRSPSGSGDDVGAPVDIDGAARDTPREWRGEIGAGEADIHDVGQLAERRMRRRLDEQEIEVLEAGRGAGLQRAGRKGVDPDVLRICTRNNPVHYVGPDI